MQELCWKIIEKRPITVYLDKDIIVVPKDKMRYETWHHLDTNHRHGTIAVSGWQYDYHTGEGTFAVNKKDDLAKWTKKYKDIIKIKKAVQ